jgi:hypothetical protein
MTNSLLLLLLFFQSEVAYKPKEEFEIKLNYEFKQKSNTVDYNKVDFVETKGERAKSSVSGLLPHLTLGIKLIKLPKGEVKIKGFDHNGHNILNKKVIEGDIVPMVLGFTDDLKDRVNSHEYNLFLIDKDKNQVNRIHLFIAEDGTFTINGEKKGKF